MSHDSQAQSQRQRQLYQDVDKRLQVLEQKLAATPRPPATAQEVPPPAVAPSPPETASASPAPTASATAPGPAKEAEAEEAPPHGKSDAKGANTAGQAEYLAAFDLLKKEKYPEAISAFLEKRSASFAD